MVMDILFVIFAAILLIALVSGVRELRSQGLPQGSGQMDFGADGGSDLLTDGASHTVHCDHGADGGHGGFDGGGGHH
jgi:hypothetical protein